MSHDDDAALRWAGDEPEPAAVPPARSARVNDELPEGVSSSSLVALGVFAGVALLSTLGWFTFASSSVYSGADPLSTVMFNLGLWLAVAAPALWFAVALWLVPAGRRRLLLLAVGAVVLLPIPVLFG